MCSSPRIHLAVILGESFPFRFLFWDNRVALPVWHRGSPSSEPGGAYPDPEWGVPGPERKGRPCSPRGITALQRGVIMRQAISPTHTPASRLCTPTLRPGQEVSLDVPEPGILQQVVAKPVGKQDEIFFFFPVLYFDLDLPSLFESLLIISAVRDRGSLLC